MARVSSEQLEKLQAFLNTLPADQKGKCALCNETLVHIVKQAEAEVGVGTATVTNALAVQINETALPADQVSGDQLRDRVRYQAGEKVSGKNPQISKADRPVTREIIKDAVASHFKTGGASRALRFAEQAIGVLENIADDDPDRYEAFGLVGSWMGAEVRACRK